MQLHGIWHVYRPRHAGAAPPTRRVSSSRSTTARPRCASTRRSWSSGATWRVPSSTRAPVARAPRPRPLRRRTPISIACSTASHDVAGRDADRRRPARPAGRGRASATCSSPRSAGRVASTRRRRSARCRTSTAGDLRNRAQRSCTRTSAAVGASPTAAASRCTARCAARVRGAARRSGAPGPATTPASRTGARPVSRRCRSAPSGSRLHSRDLGAVRREHVAIAAGLLRAVERGVGPAQGRCASRRRVRAPRCRHENVVTAPRADQLLRTRSSAVWAPSAPAAGSTSANSSPP